MGPLNDLGLLKMDFLGLRTLTVLHDAVELIRQRLPDFSLEQIPMDDAATFALLNRAETIGIFQLEGGMTGFCKQFDFKSIDDIIALSALYRPGPMDLIPDYIKRKKGLAKIKYEHPLLEEVCADTYGVMIYQEQVMAAASRLGGYSLGQADLLRRAMGKKDREKMAKERANFIEGCARDEQDPGEKGERDFRFAGEICRLRIQQEPQRGLRIDQLSDRLSEGELPGRIHGRFAEQRDQQHGQDFDLRRRVQADGNSDPAARREPERIEIHSGNWSRGR